MTYSISVDLRPLASAISDEAMARVFPVIRQVVVGTAEGIQSEWQEQVYRSLPIRDEWTRHRADAAVESISISYPGPFHAVVRSSHEAVFGVEEGFPARDLKLMLRTSGRTKVSKTGKRYLTIPFRHNTSGTALAPAMPSGIQQQVRGLLPSKVTGRGLRLNANGQPTAAFKYLWGGRLPAGLTPKLLPSHKSDPHAGMVRMTTGPKSSAFLTFRTMSESSTGWIIPAKPGQYIAKSIASKSQAEFADRIVQILAAIGT